MTALTAAPGTTTSPRAAIGLGIATSAVSLTLTVLFAHTWGEVAIVAPAIVVVAAIVYGVVVPRALRRESPGGTALGLAVLAALLVVPAFWSGLPAVLGVAAMILGNAGRGREGSGKAIAALVLAALTVAFHVSIYVMEGMQGMAGLPS